MNPRKRFSQYTSTHFRTTLTELVRDAYPKNALEFGYRYGYSTAIIARALPPDGWLTSYDLRHWLIPKIYCALAGRYNIHFIQCPADLAAIPMKTDFVWIDVGTDGALIHRLYRRLIPLLERGVPVYFEGGGKERAELCRQRGQLSVDETNVYYELIESRYPPISQMLPW